MAQRLLASAPAPPDGVRQGPFGILRAPGTTTPGNLDQQVGRNMAVLAGRAPSFTPPTAAGTALPDDQLVRGGKALLGPGRTLDQRAGGGSDVAQALATIAAPGALRALGPARAAIGAAGGAAGGFVGNNLAKVLSAGPGVQSAATTLGGGLGALIGSRAPSVNREDVLGALDTVKGGKMGALAKLVQAIRGTPTEAPAKAAVEPPPPSYAPAGVSQGSTFTPGPSGPPAPLRQSPLQPGPAAQGTPLAQLLNPPPAAPPTPPPTGLAAGLPGLRMPSGSPFTPGSTPPGSLPLTPPPADPLPPGLATGLPGLPMPAGRPSPTLLKTRMDTPTAVPALGMKGTTPLLRSAPKPKVVVPEPTPQPRLPGFDIGGGGSTLAGPNPAPLPVPPVALKSAPVSKLPTLKDFNVRPETRAAALKAGFTMDQELTPTQQGLLQTLDKGQSK